jgi:hypothetical protein
MHSGLNIRQAALRTTLFVGAGGGLEAPAAQKHATVLGLSAFVLASPYDVPEWLPALLLALVRAASQPAPIKTTVRCAEAVWTGIEEMGIRDFTLMSMRDHVKYSIPPCTIKAEIDHVFFHRTCN